MTTGPEHTLEHEFELHFTEGFSGETLRVAPANHIPFELHLKTRLQIGLAHIEILKLFDREEVEITIEELGIKHRIFANSRNTIIIFHLTEKALHIEYPTTRPGYL